MLVVQRQHSVALKTVPMVKHVNLFVCFSGGSGSVFKVRVRHSYQDIVEACCKGLWPNWPGLGGWMVNVAQVTLFFKTSVTIFQVSWNKLQ